MNRIEIVDFLEGRQPDFGVLRKLLVKPCGPGLLGADAKKIWITDIGSGLSVYRYGRFGPHVRFSEVACYTGRPCTFYCDGAARKALAELGMDASGVVKIGVLNAMLPLFREALQAGQKQRAAGIAMRAAEYLLAKHPEHSREALWNTFFSKLRQLPRYQAYDFEIADYQLYDALPRPMLFRGPPPDYLSLATGRFVTLLGAAQLFGRFQATAPHTIVEEKAKIACLNLSMAGAGPESFLTPDVLAVARRGKAVVLQVLSGRSVGCDEYPGLGVTHRQNDGSKAKRLAILREVRQQSREEAVRLVAKWQYRYVELMRQLIADLRVPVLLVWISARSPDDWAMSEVNRGGNFGDFPHLVERSMVEAIAAGAATYLEISGDPDLPHAFESRFGTGKCPRFGFGGEQAWGNSYYPSAQLSRRAAEAVGGALLAFI